MSQTKYVLFTHGNIGIKKKQLHMKLVYIKPLIETDVSGFALKLLPTE